MHSQFFDLDLSPLAYLQVVVEENLSCLGGGYLFGLPVGFVADSIGAAGAAFLLGRTIGRSFVVSKLKDYPKFSSVAIAIQKSGFKPITLALVYIGTTLKDLSDVTHGWSEFSTTRWVLIVLGLVVSDNIPDLARKPPSSLSRASAQIHTVYSPFQMQIVVQKMRDSRVPWVRESFDDDDDDDEESFDDDDGCK
ncbi:hypothetical protein NC652_037614 [Populus alba x Populus x berolinensis]|uniref:Uncharacterized protein n=1 Tax=Populus alba x Populus x berolinensis TaxID=444605 RepID=A0AAD6LF24_9ROSI|nr:hypothetical protein NC652_037614 [Populus alba x Populus x berolinensis]KAJ6959204.1 hypothetical protein NC653_037496 [Populus alba x Populus x berolinensis]